MNVTRRIQSASMALILTGAATFLIMAPKSASASTTCSEPEYSECIPDVVCEGDGQSICNGVTPPGCTLTSWECVDSGPLCNENEVFIDCFFD